MSNAQTRLDFAEFSKADWMGYAGAEIGENGEQPQLASFEDADYYIDVIVDANGIEVTATHKDTDAGFAGATFTLETELTFGGNLAFGRGLYGEQLTEESLLALGFIRIL